MLDPERLFSALDASRVDYVLVGGLAVAAHGGDNATTDFDLSLATSPQNHERLAQALNRLEPRTRSGAPIALDAASFGGEFVDFRTAAGQVDIIKRIPVPGGYAGLRERALDVDLGGCRAVVASLDDLIAMKAASERGKDRIHLHTLRALQGLTAEQSEPDAPG